MVLLHLILTNASDTKISQRVVLSMRHGSHGLFMSENCGNACRCRAKRNGSQGQFFLLEFLHLFNSLTLLTTSCISSSHIKISAHQYCQFLHKFRPIPD